MRYIINSMLFGPGPISIRGIPWITVLLVFFSFACSTSRSPLDGTWKQKGLGRIMEVKNGQFIIYSSTAGYCNQLTSGNFDKHFRIIDVSEEDLVINYGSPRNYYFTRISELPQICASRETNQNFDPVYNFKVLWHLFDDNYAFFDERDVNWDQVRIALIPKIEKLKSQREFYQVLKELLDSLNDAHVKLNVPDSIKPQMDDDGTINFEMIKNEIPGAILDKYVDSPRSYNYGTISWGKLKNTNTGYIVVPRMFGFPDYRLSEQEFNNKLNEVFSADPGPGYKYYMDEKEGVEHVMEKIYADLSGTDSIVFDLRFNEGGMSGPSLQLLSHFIDKPLMVFRKKLNIGTADYIDQEVYIQPAKSNVFDQRISLLTSHWTASASEAFALGTLSLENFKRYGSPTSGILSEVVFAVLPNGWEVSMSVDIITDRTGNIYEVNGIPVDKSVNYPEEVTLFYNSFFKDEEFKDHLIEKFIN